MKLKTSLLLMVSLAASSLCAQGLEYIKANYTKYEYEIVARDGKKLFTSVYVPKDTSHPYPIMLMRTPYSVGPYGEDNYRNNLGPSDKFGKDGFIFAYQDVRGRWMSEGQFMDVRPHKAVKNGSAGYDESTVTWDTIDWLVKHIPNNSGRVGMWGISYPGFYTTAGIIDAHPALKAASPQAPVTEWFIGDDFHHNGALYLPHAFRFLQWFEQKLDKPTREQPKPFDFETPNGYEFYQALGSLANADERFFKGRIAFWNEMMQHGTYDTFWQERNVRPRLRNIHAAVLTVGGWFDAEDLFGALQVYRS